MEKYIYDIKSHSAKKMVFQEMIIKSIIETFFS